MVSQTRALPNGGKEEVFEHPSLPAVHQRRISCTECGRRVVLSKKRFAGKRRGYCGGCGISWREEISLGRSRFYGTRIIKGKKRGLV